jgi:starch phosphorylase
MPAGDTIRSAADMGVLMVAVTLLHPRGYFFQRPDGSGWQSEEPVNWQFDDHLVDTGVRLSAMGEERPVTVRAWRYDVHGEGGDAVPIFLLDTDLPENSEWDRSLTDFLRAAMSTTGSVRR